MKLKKNILYLLFGLLILQNANCANSNFFSLGRTINIIDKICHDYPGLDTQLFFRDIGIRQLLLVLPIALYAASRLFASNQGVSKKNKRRILQCSTETSMTNEAVARIQPMAKKHAVDIRIIEEESN